MARISYAGGAARTTLSGSMTAGSPTDGGTFTVGDGTGYPDGAIGSFVVSVGRGTASEEKILCSVRSGSTFTVATDGRGYDDTTATSHDAGDTVEHVVDAASLDDVQDHVYDTTRNDHSQYLLKTLFDANSILIATADDTPVALTVAASRILGRKASGDIVAMTAAELFAILGTGTPSGTTFLRGDGAWAASTSTSLCQINGFSYTQLAASQTALQLQRPAFAGALETGIAVPVVMDRAGSIVGISVAGDITRTAGTATFEVYKNGTGVGLTCVLNGTDTQYAYGVQAGGTDTFVAGDRLGVRVTTDASWAPTTMNVDAQVTVQFS